MRSCKGDRWGGREKAQPPPSLTLACSKQLLSSQELCCTCTCHQTHPSPAPAQPGSLLLLVCVAILTGKGIGDHGDGQGEEEMNLMRMDEATEVKLLCLPGSWSPLPAPRDSHGPITTVWDPLTICGETEARTASAPPRSPKECVMQQGMQAMSQAPD